MGKVVATYLVKVTLREPEGWRGSEAEGLKEPLGEPTNDELASTIEATLDLEFGPLTASVTSERTDI